MSSRQIRTQNNVPQSGPTSIRRSEYFISGDGIDREVITADICRFLGNDALVRPGSHEIAGGRVIQGYFVTAYRNLTTAMIQDLKAQSAKWEKERHSAIRTPVSTSGSISSGQSLSDNQFVLLSSNVVNPSRQGQGYTISQPVRDHPFPDSPVESPNDSFHATHATGSNVPLRFPGSGNPAYHGASAPNQAAWQPPQNGFVSPNGYSSRPHIPHSNLENPSRTRYSHNLDQPYPGASHASTPAFGQNSEPYSDSLHFAVRDVTGSSSRGIPGDLQYLSSIQRPQQQGADAQGTQQAANFGGLSSARPTQSVANTNVHKPTPSPINHPAVLEYAVSPANDPYSRYRDDCLEYCGHSPLRSDGMSSLPGSDLKNWKANSQRVRS